MVWGVRRGACLTLRCFPQDNDVVLHWAPVEEAGDATQILFSKKVGFLFLLLSPGSRQWKAFGRVGYNSRPSRGADVTLFGFLISVKWG